MPDVRYDDDGASGVVEVADGIASIATCVQPGPESTGNRCGTFSATALRIEGGERRPYQERPWPQDGRQRRDLDRRFDSLRPDQGKLRSGRGDPATSLAAARPHAIDP